MIVMIVMPTLPELAVNQVLSLMVPIALLCLATLQAV